MLVNNIKMISDFGKNLAGINKDNNENNMNNNPRKNSIVKDF